MSTLIARNGVAFIREGEIVAIYKDEKSDNRGHIVLLRNSKELTISYELAVHLAKSLGKHEGPYR